MSDNKAGQPTKYKEEYCKDIITLASGGLHMYAIAVTWDVCYDTLSEWRKVHPKFSAAYARARTIQTSSLLNKLLQNIGNKDFNHNIANLLLTHICRLRTEKLVKIDTGEGNLSKRGLKTLDVSKEGSHTADEISRIVDSISKLAKIDEVTELREKIEMLEKEV